MINSSDSLKTELKQKMAYAKSGIKRKAKGALKYDYLVPAGPYEEQWDWDAFFMGVALASDISSEAIYLRNWALNYIINAESDGKVAGCVTSEGADPRLKQMKPLLAQGVLISSRFLDDYSWIEPHWEQFLAVVTYRERNFWNKEYDLATWYDAMESGADNNVAAYRSESLKGMEAEFGDKYDQILKEKGGHIKETIEDYPKGSVIAADVNAFIYREYLAVSQIAEKLSKTDIAREYAEKATKIKEGVNKHLWNDADGAYYNIDSTTGDFIKKISYSTFLPLFAQIASPEQAKQVIEKYLLNDESMWSEYGIRSLSKDDTHYNNINMIKPHSNWQGPIWPIANYIYMQALLNYGYQEKALELAKNVSTLVLDDINTSGGMHENYDAETGKPLAAPNFISWNLLVYNMLDEAEASFNPFNL